MQRTKDLQTQDDWGTVKNVERLLSGRRRCSVMLQEEAVIPQEYV